MWLMPVVLCVLKVGALCKAIEAAEDIKYGSEALPRHLRRRATSHNSYHHCRRPRQPKASQPPPQQPSTHGGMAEAISAVRML